MSVNKPRIPTAEFQLRVDKVRHEMASQGLDCVFVYGDEYRREYLRYVSNCWPIFERGALIIPWVGEPILLAAPEGEEVVWEKSHSFDVCREIDPPSPWERRLAGEYLEYSRGVAR